MVQFRIGKTLSEWDTALGVNMSCGTRLKSTTQSSWEFTGWLWSVPGGWCRRA